MSKNEDRLNAFFEVLLSDLSLHNDLDDKVHFALSRLFMRARKRARYNNANLNVQAVDAFVEANRIVGQTEIRLDRQLVNDAKYFITVVLERFTSSFDETAIQTPLDMSFIYDNWKFGPGASFGVKGSHTAQKIVQKMTSTERAVPLVRKLRFINPYFRLTDEREGCGITVVSGSRLATVPKNEDTVRTIAIEPSGNMALQLAAGKYLEGALRSVGLDITTQQPKNKALACGGSISNGLATIDLKSASDMISIELVRLLLPKDWFDLLMAIRSPEMVLPDDRVLQLNMISTMGNGFTFPLMTLILAALIYGFRAQRGGPNLFIDWTQTAVYGDDIIIPVDEYLPFTEVLVGAGLIVNYDKSFSDGPFRESCGGDYYKGYDVTPFYVKSLQSPTDVYVAINQVLDWCGRHNIFLARTLNLLISYLGRRVFLVPEWCNPNQGLLTASCSRRYSYLSIVPSYKRFERPSVFEMMLAIGGYTAESGPNHVYLPRVSTPLVKVRKSRLPQGFLDGADPLKRSALVSGRISTFVSILLC